MTYLVEMISCVQKRHLNLVCKGTKWLFGANLEKQNHPSTNTRPLTDKQVSLSQRGRH